jgi:hypothetical protein
MSTCEPTTSETKEALFLLSAELRNMVYGYVLTTPNAALEYTTDDASGHKQINQLQYVNKQLHQECADLELKFNPTITVFSRVEDDTTATEQFFELLAYLPPERQDWLQTVILYSEAPDIKPASPPVTRFRIPDSRVNMFRLAELCGLMPNMTVKYKLSIFSARILGKSILYSDDLEGPPYSREVIKLGSAFSLLPGGNLVHALWPSEPDKRYWTSSALYDEDDGDVEGEP